MKRRSNTRALILFFILGIVLGVAGTSPAAIDAHAETATPPVVTGSQLVQEKIDFLMATLQDRLEQLPEADRPTLFLGKDFARVSGLDELQEAILNPDHPLHGAFTKAGRLHQDAQLRPALADDANLYLNLAILSALDELLQNPSMGDEIKNTVYALIDLLKELELPEAYQVPDTRFSFNEFGRPDDRDRIERGNDGDVQPLDDEKRGFKFYGKEYDLDSDVTVYSDGFIIFGAAPANEAVQLPSAYSDYRATEGGLPWGALNLETNMPAMLSPLVSHPEIGGIRVAGGGVEKTDLRYTYRWQVQFEEAFGRVAPDAVSYDELPMPAMETSASLYRNDWIVFNYENQAGSGAYPYMSMPGIAGLSPGDGSQGSGHPGEGQPRDWYSGVGFTLDALFAGPLTYDGDAYTAIYNGYSADSTPDSSAGGDGLPFVFADTFYIFRPYAWGEEGMVATPNKYMVSAGTRSILAGGLSSLDEAIGYVADDPGLLQEIDGGAFTPDNYEFGLQAGADWIGSRLIAGDGFIAYAVQVEEDIVNRKILEMHQEAFQQGRIQSVLENIQTAKGYSLIRERDAWMEEKSDAQAGRVLRDHNGNWVRVQQYVLRPDAKTVQILSASLRDVDGQSALSTLDFTTTFRDSYGMNEDLQKLPWNSWLNTKSESVGDATFKYIEAQYGYPQLDAMSVTIKNPSDQQFQETRTFAGTEMPGAAVYAANMVSAFCVIPQSKQYITNETLKVSGVGTFANKYYFEGGTPASADVAFMNSGGSGGFSYQFADAITPPIQVSLYELSGLGSKQSGESYDDIWDALRVNEDNGPNIGKSDLEMVITDAAKEPRFNEFDVVYIPMSRMIWKDKPAT